MLNKIKYKGELGFFFYKVLYKTIGYFKSDRKSDKRYLTELFEKRQGYALNIENPRSLNEKIQWLKINDRDDFQTQLADKYAIREFISKNIGEEYLIPLVYTTFNYQDIKPENLPDYPFIIKANHDSGSYKIIKDKSNINWEKLRVDCRWWLSNNYYWFEREWQYKNIKPRIIVEKLLITKEGKIPFDYKLNVINGKVEFIYVSLDREGNNKRNIYDRDWNPLYFTWANKSKNITELRGNEIEKPSTMDEMISIAEKIGKMFPYVRVDFYDIDGKIYFGEITQHHGGGFDQIRPIEFDYKFGEMLDLKYGSR
jgi:hypothetical protein